VHCSSTWAPRIAIRRDVRKYLREFLMTAACWTLRGRSGFAWCISPFCRPPQGICACLRKDLDEGWFAPVVTSKRVQAALQQGWAFRSNSGCATKNPSIGKRGEETGGQRGRRRSAHPVFPHYAMSSFETAVARVRKSRQTRAADEADGATRRAMTRRSTSRRWRRARPNTWSRTTIICF